MYIPEPDEIIHYGVKGMHWGVRKGDEVSGRLQNSSIQIDSDIHPKTKQAATEISQLIGERYGYLIKSVKTLGPDNPEYPGTIAYVKSNYSNNKSDKGDHSGTIFVQSRDFTETMKTLEQMGWMVSGTANVKGLLTHESAHSIFHADQKIINGPFGQKIKGGNIKARDKALRAALKVSMQDRHSIFDISGYAHNAGVREELEAEMFSQYHWADNPSRAVTEWGRVLHKELGIDPTPFKEMSKHG